MTNQPSIGDMCQELKRAQAKIAEAKELFKDLETWITPLPGFEYAKIDRETSDELRNKMKEGGWIV